MTGLEWFLLVIGGAVVGWVRGRGYGRDEEQTRIARMLVDDMERAHLREEA